MGSQAALKAASLPCIIKTQLLLFIHHKEKRLLNHCEEKSVCVPACSCLYVHDCMQPPVRAQELGATCSHSPCAAQQSPRVHLQTRAEPPALTGSPGSSRSCGFLSSVQPRLQPEELVIYLSAFEMCRGVVCPEPCQAVPVGGQPSTVQALPLHDMLGLRL